MKFKDLVVGDRFIVASEINSSMSDSGVSLQIRGTLLHIKIVETVIVLTDHRSATVNGMINSLVSFSSCFAYIEDEAEVVKIRC